MPKSSQASFDMTSPGVANRSDSADTIDSTRIWLTGAVSTGHASEGHLMTFVLHPLLVMLASLTHQELARQVVFLREENRVLRSRLPKRIAVTPCERSRLLTLGRDLGTQLRGLISIIRDDTFRRWVREAEAAHITHEQSTRRTGRPRTARDIRELVLRLVRENSWGLHPHLG